MKKIRPIAAGAALALTLSGCAGSAGVQGSAEGGDGFAYGASQEEIDKVLDGLEPITLKYQTAAASPKSIQAKADVWPKAIEKMSGGKIEVDVVYGQSIAGFAEVHDALADGRVDLAYTLPSYDPTRFPNFDSLGFSLSSIPASPLVSELVASAVGTEVGWNSEALLGEQEGEGLVPLFPVAASANFLPACVEEGATAEDWEGRQVRASSQAHEEMIKALDATPVSLEYVEVFEALQRNTIDCALNSMNSAVDFGFLDVSPHVSYATSASIPRAPGAILGGSRVASMPLAYRQILFDSLVDGFVGSAEVVIDGNYEGVKQLHDNGGTIEELDDESQQTIKKTNANMIEAIEEKGNVGSDIGAQVDESTKKWAAKAEELGYTEEGDFGDFDEWYDEDMDFRPFAEAVYADVLKPHRPQ